MNVAPIDVDEVHDVAVNDAIEKVSERAAEDQRQAKPRQAVVEAQLRAVGGNRQEGERSDYEHDHRLVREIDRVQQPEGHSGVLDVREIRQAGDERTALAERQRVAHQRLGDLVEDDHERDDADLERAREGKLLRGRGRRRRRLGDCAFVRLHAAPRSP